MNRRKFILGSIVGGATVGAGGGWLYIDKNEEPLDIDSAVSRLNLLMEHSPSATGEWSLSQIFNHCAQSVEYSMLGYPKNKPDIFRNTVGKSVFAGFSSKRKMIHALDEPIPGAPGFSNEGNVTDAFERFRKSLIDFKQYGGVLAPHFAYGELTKPQYEMAHVMHFNNHLQEIDLAGVSG